MNEQAAEFWTKAVEARQELIDLYADNLEVTLIDIGYPTETCMHAEEVVLRVHVTEEWFETEASNCVQPEVNGIPICVLHEYD